MKSFAYLLLFVFAPFSGDAQSAIASWEQVFNGETGRAITHFNTSDGGVILVTNTTDSVSGNSPTSIIKSDINGNVQWSYRFGQSLYFVSNVAEGPDSSLTIAYTENSLTDDQKEIHALKLDAGGNLLFSKNYRLPPQYITSEHAPGLLVRNNGQYYLSSQVADSTTLLSHLQVMSLDTNGNVLWSNIYDTATNHLDGTFLDTCSNGDLFVATSSSNSIGTEVCADIMRVGPSGNLSWYKHLIMPNHHLHIVSLVATSTDSFYLVSGMYIPFTTLPELSVILTNGFGNVLWSQRYFPPGVPWSIQDASVNDSAQLTITGLVENSFFSDGSLVCMINSNGQVVNSQYSPWFYYTSVDYRSNGYFSVAGSGGMAYENPVYVLLDSALHGCADQSFGVLVVNKPLSYSQGSGSAPMLMQSSNDSLIQVAGTIVTNINCPPVGMEDKSESLLEIYPIPATSNLIIESSRIPDLIEIFSVKGEKIYSSTPDHAKTEIQTDSWARGLYFVKVTVGSEVAMRKIITE